MKTLSNFLNILEGEIFSLSSEKNKLFRIKNNQLEYFEEGADLCSEWQKAPYKVNNLLDLEFQIVRLPEITKKEFNYLEVVISPYMLEGSTLKIVKRPTIVDQSSAIYIKEYIDGLDHLCLTVARLNTTITFPFNGLRENFLYDLNTLRLASIAEELRIEKRNVV